MSNMVIILVMAMESKGLSNSARQDTKKVTKILGVSSNKTRKGITATMINLLMALAKSITQLRSKSLVTTVVI